MSDIYIVLVMTPYSHGGIEYLAYGPFYKHENAAFYASDYGDTDEVQISRLKEVGFKRVERWFQAFSFRGYIAWK